MKLFIFLFIFNSFSTPILDEFRKKFPEIISEKQVDYYLTSLENEKSTESRGYFAAMLFMKSKYVVSPIKKYNSFKKGKTILDNIIKENKSNIEIRYLRFIFQNQLPNFLNYNANIDEDFLAITKGIENYNLETKFKKNMLKNMLMVKNITTYQTNKIKLINQKL